MLTARLRRAETSFCSHGHENLIEDAADRIEELEKVLAKIANHQWVRGGKTWDENQFESFQAMAKAVLR